MEPLTVENLNLMIPISSFYAECNENDVLQITASSSAGYVFVSADYWKNLVRKCDDITVKFSSGDSSINISKYESLKRLTEIKNLPDNWNDNNAKKFSAKFISYVRTILTHLEIEPDVFPTARDSIQLEYENSAGDYLEFEIFEDRKIKKFFYGNDGKTSTDFVSETQLNGIVNQFYG